MILDTWLEQLQKAKTEGEVVAFARSHLDRIGATRIPDALDGQVLQDGEDLRRVAVGLSRAQTWAAESREETDIAQQMLIVFSLATDRLNQLEGHGLASRASHGAVPMR